MRFIIDFKNHLTSEEITNFISSNGGTLTKTFSISDKTYLVEFPEKPIFDDSIHDHLIHDDENPLTLLSTVIYSDQTWGTKQLNGSIATISTTDDKDWWKNYVVKHPEFDKETYQIDRKGDDIPVYVLDSGCEISHPDFVNRPVTNLFSFTNDFTDTNGHGTAIASLITGATCGITDATVKVVKIFDNSVPTKQSDMINALDAIYVDFMQSPSNFAVINCSWTITKNEFIESKLQKLIDLGAVVVAAAGNNGSPIENVTPAGMPDAITIGSFNNNLVPSDFSNYTGSGVALTQNQTNYGSLDGWAPGEQIYAAGLNGTYVMTAGTSMACAIHSAACAYDLCQSDMQYVLDLPLKEFVEITTLARKNLLDLSDPKYQMSKNRVSTATDQLLLDESTTTITTKAVANSGKNHSIRLFDPRVYKKLEIFGDLPAGYTVTELGVFMGKAVEVSTPTVQAIPMRLTDNNNQDLDFEFELITLPNSFVIGTDTTNDPELDIKLQAGSCFNFFCYTTPGTSCSNDCTPSPVILCVKIPDKLCPSGYSCECA